MKNDYAIRGDVTAILILLRRDGTRHEVIIDTEDIPTVAAYRWSLKTQKNRRVSYAHAWVPGEGGHIKLHRLIMGASSGEHVDHINGNGLDNRKDNLRVCTHGENMFNKFRYRGSMSKYKGVTGCQGRWRARIQVSGRSLHLGYFDTEEEAARAYDKAAEEHFGEFARFNFPEGTSL